jgi:hypothetical protein
MSLIKIPQPHLWTPPPLRQERGGRRQSFERHFARKRKIARPEPLLAGPGLAQAVVNSQTNGSGQVAYGSSVTSGNLLVFVYLEHDITYTGATVVDSLGVNTWANIVNSTPTSGASGGVSFWATITKASGACTITAHDGTGLFVGDCVLWEFSGFPLGYTLDGTPQTAVSNSTAAVSVGPIVTSNATDALVCAAWFQDTCTGVGSGWTGGPTVSANGYEYRFTTTSGSYTGSLTPADIFSGAIVAFAPVTPPAPPVGTTNDPIFFGCDF